MKKLLITLITLALLVTALVSCGESEPKPAEAYVNGTHLSGYTGLLVISPAKIVESASRAAIVA